jgi:hypothetical protein
MDAEAYERQLRKKPSWRFRRKQAISKKIAEAQPREHKALRLLDEDW